jgi:hypothetical protein
MYGSNTLEPVRAQQIFTNSQMERAKKKVHIDKVNTLKMEGDTEKFKGGKIRRVVLRAGWGVSPTSP